MDAARATVLFAEDNESHARLVMRSLEEHQLADRVVHVRDGESVVNFLLRQGEYSDPADAPRPDILLLDLRLPKVDGLEVLRFVKQHEDLRQLPVVVLTTSDARNDILQAYRLQANSYLVKPLDFDAFHSMLRDLGSYWLTWNKSPRS